VRISVVPLGRDVSRGEALILQAETPPEVKQGAPFQVNLVAESLLETDGTLTLYRNADPVAKRQVRLRPGKTVVGFEESLPAGGLYRYRAILDVPAGHDTVPDNNVAYAYTRVAGKPKVLIVEGAAGDGKHLANALRANDLQVVLAGPDAIPANLAECAQYDSVVLANVPAWHMSPTQMTVIRSAVRDTGMGFAMVGGEASFGAGGYRKTPIEDALPVDMDLKQQKAMPPLSLVIVVDCSGSMTMDEDGVMKIRLAAKAAQEAAGLLQPVDRICVFGYDTARQSVVAMRAADDLPRIKTDIDALAAGGGGILAREALEEAYQEIRDEPTAAKHIILCADTADTELSAPSDEQKCYDIAARMKREGITMSVVGFGQRTDPHVRLQQSIAKAAGGPYYVVERVSNLAQVFVRDVLIVARSPLVEEPFRPTAIAEHTALRGLPIEAAPLLRGYVTTSMKDSPVAQPLLATHKGDPLLAVWPYGLGRSLAFTSDATAHWGHDWLGWGGYASYWAQTLRWTLRQATPPGFQASIQEDRGRVLISVDAVSADGAFRNLLDLRARVALVTRDGGTPADISEALQLQQVAPGRYQTAFEARHTGAYVITVTEHAGDTMSGMQTLTYTVPYSPEFQTVTPDDAVLHQLVAAGQGTLDPKPQDVFGVLRFAARVLRDWWPVLVVILAFLFLLDVALRRILLPWSEVFAMAGAFAGRVLPRRTRPAQPSTPAPAPAGHGRSATVGGLLSIKTRGRSRPEPAPTPDTATVAPPTTARADAPKGAAATAPPPASGSMAGQLLKKKRERQGD
jgi:uncharacterized membrane protein